MDQNYKPNSHKYKEEQKATSDERKKLEKVVSGKVQTRKKNGFQKFASEFVSENASNIKTYIVKDVIIPAIKKSISDVIDMILYGGARKSGVNASRVSYRSYYDDPRPRMDSPARVSRFNYDEVVVESRGDAEAVISQLNEIIDMYGMASVADFYDLVGISGDFTDNKYGWTNLRNAEPIRLSNGYAFRLPKALPIK
jgi:hypothetical protein